jgi:signal transduction histidine kinase/ActR/RegA family two-component response regulator
MVQRSIQRKLLGVMLVTTLVAVVVALGAMITYDLRESHQGWVEEIGTQAELLGRTSAAALEFDDAKVAQENLALLRHQPKIRAAALYGPRGQLFARYVPRDDPQPLPALPQADGVHVENGHLHAFSRIVDRGQILGTVYLRAEYALRDRMLNYAGIALLVLAVAMLVALAVSSWLQRLVTGPILAIGAVAREVVQQQNYSRRADKTSDDEVGGLVDAFNNMLAEIERRTRAVEESSREKERLNEQLEQRVLERTAQLESSNRELAVATDVAERANRAKSEFLSRMSHELRTPLNAIIGFGQLLSTETMAATEVQKRTFTDHIVKAGKHLLALINDILNLAQIEAGKLELSLEPVLLADVLADCKAMTEPLGKKRNIRVLFPEQIELAVLADRTRLKQVLLNLLSNAIKYNRDGGAVVVDCMRPAPERIRISVQDTGLGLEAEQVKALFQPFNRLGQEVGSEEGTGIGLVVTKHLVELMGGEIGVSSTPGTGSLFWIELEEKRLAAAPAENPFVHATMSEAVPESGHGVSTVLCIEDNPANLALVRGVLGFRSDLRLMSAPEGRAGVELARVYQPQVILMDNNMPGMSGHEALAILRADPKTSHIPVIALTANAMGYAVEEGLQRGFFRYLTKPVDVKELVRAVDSALSVRRPPDDAGAAGPVTPPSGPSPPR